MAGTKKVSVKKVVAPVVKKEVMQVTINEDGLDPIYLVQVEGATDQERRRMAHDKALTRFYADHPTESLDSLRINYPDDDIDAIIG